MPADSGQRGQLDLLGEVICRLGRLEGVDYADARWVRDERDAILVRDLQPARTLQRETQGVGVRVLFRGAWGFAAVPLPVAGEIEAAASLAGNRALEVARASAAVNRKGVRLAEEDPQKGIYRTPILEDAFERSLEERVSDLARPVEVLWRRPTVRSAKAHAAFFRQTSALATSEGTAVEQTLYHASAGLQLIVERDGLVQQRSFPMNHDGACASKGYELVRHLAFSDRVEGLYEETQQLLRAPPLPEGEATLLLDPSQLALQIHESCGHPSESDRAMGDEVSLAGASFLTPDLRGRLQYGSPIVHLTADATTPGGMGTFGWDDEGVPARRVPLVEAGRFVNYLSSRETAAHLGLGRSSGAMRAESWSRVPIIRMVNVNLEPGSGSYEDLLADTDQGYLMACNKSWSIDQLRLNFQFGCEIAWEIKGGKRGQVFRNPVYGGRSPEFWGGCDRIAGGNAWELHGFLHCGKGDPMQSMHVGHGCAPARFRCVRVGSSG